MAERLDRGLIDFGTLIEPVEVGKYDSLRLPRPDVWGLLLRWDHPLARQAVVRPEDLADLPSLSPGRWWEKTACPAGWGMTMKLHIVSTGNLVNNLILLVEEGVGCALTLDGVVKAAGAASASAPGPPAGIVDVPGMEEVPDFFPGGGGLFAPGTGEFIRRPPITGKRSGKNHGFYQTLKKLWWFS